MRILAPLAAALISCALVPAAHAQNTGTARGAQARPRVPYTGINVSGQPRFEGGAFRWAVPPTIATVDPGSPAQRVGIRAGDILLLVNGGDARDPETMVGEPGKSFVFRVRRGGEVREYTLTSTAIPTARPNG